ncbi:unnamed protein product [Rotaria sp. Silwood2]|nr:unnamed protein product [Rotaria sp. Silwood2]CAF4576877.1 unnamed protein product [Rotaria sp. Silwood2]
MANGNYCNTKLDQLIDRCQSGSEIDLSVKQLTDEDIPIVIEKAIIGKQCTVLILSQNNITANGAAVLADALRNNTTLIGLSLWDNPIGDAGVQSLIQALTTNNSVLKRLGLQGNGITDQGAQYLAEMLKTNRTLTALDIQ